MVDSPYYEKLLIEGTLGTEDVEVISGDQQNVTDQKDKEEGAVDHEADAHPGYGFGV